MRLYGVRLPRLDKDGGGGGGGADDDKDKNKKKDDDKSDKGEGIPEWAKKLQEEVASLKAGSGSAEGVQKIPETKPPKEDKQPEDKQPEQQQQQQPEAKKSKSWMDWLL